jgi:hypothetical protein
MSELVNGGVVGVGREKSVADPLTCTPRKKSVTNFEAQAYIACRLSRGLLGRPRSSSTYERGNYPFATCIKVTVKRCSKI